MRTVLLSLLLMGIAGTAWAQTDERQIPASDGSVSETPVTINPDTAKIEPEAKIYGKTDTRPSYRAGKYEMARHVTEEIRYPRRATAMGMEGKVHVTFVIELDGTISNPAVTRGVSLEMDAEALRVVKTLGAFNPGMIDGKAVRTRVTLPIRFKLESYPPEDTASEDTAN